MANTERIREIVAKWPGPDMTNYELQLTTSEISNNIATVLSKMACVENVDSVSESEFEQGRAQSDMAARYKYHTPSKEKCVGCVYSYWKCPISPYEAARPEAVLVDGEMMKSLTKSPGESILLAASAFQPGDAVSSVNVKKVQFVDSGSGQVLFMKDIKTPGYGIPKVFDPALCTSETEDMHGNAKVFKLEFLPTSPDDPNCSECPFNPKYIPEGDINRIRCPIIRNLPSTEE